METLKLRKGFCEGIIKGERASLAKAITLIESILVEDKLEAEILIEKILPHTGNSIRIGISGSPGVGKSSLIEVFGSYLTSIGKKVAVLAVDPSSAITKGSILADKTRMESLSTNPMAYVRPSPSKLYLGGANADTRNVILLCESAGFEIILIETVGVGQSETKVHEMVDYFVLLALAGAGDELQVIKKGIMEIADRIIITKADGPNKELAIMAQKNYQTTIHGFANHEIPIDIFSIEDPENSKILWQNIEKLIGIEKLNGNFDKKRNSQKIPWFHELIKDKIIFDFYQNEKNNIKIKTLENEILKSNIGVNKALKSIFNSEK